ncbi:hypothetical protein ACFTAO_49735 [Paenibacillus rhizoplanae]
MNKSRVIAGITSLVLIMGLAAGCGNSSNSSSADNGSSATGKNTPVTLKNVGRCPPRNQVRSRSWTTGTRSTPIFRLNMYAMLMMMTAI